MGNIQRLGKPTKSLGITLDTMHLTNKYDIQFTSFVRVNYHGHSILLGCRLISHYVILDVAIMHV